MTRRPPCRRSMTSSPSPAPAAGPCACCTAPRSSICKAMATTCAWWPTAVASSCARALATSRSGGAIAASSACTAATWPTCSEPSRSSPRWTGTPAYASRMAASYRSRVASSRACGGDSASDSAPAALALVRPRMRRSARLRRRVRDRLGRCRLGAGTAPAEQAATWRRRLAALGDPPVSRGRPWACLATLPGGRVTARPAAEQQEADAGHPERDQQLQLGRQRQHEDERGHHADVTEQLREQPGAHPVERNRAHPDREGDRND